MIKLLASPLNSQREGKRERQIEKEKMKTNK